MSKLILSLEDENTSLFSKQYLSLIELCDEIEKQLEDLQKMDKRKKKELKKAKEDVNFLIDMYNARAKFKTYNRVK
jgi:flagellar biosynthesis/type III secretory pathway chaperone